MSSSLTPIQQAKERLKHAARLPERLSWRGRRPRERPQWYFDRNGWSPTEGLVLGGASRSGTTLVRVMLDSHPDLVCGPESALFLPILNETQLSRWFDVSRREIRRWERESPTYPQFVARFLEEYAQRRGKRHWAEKTPRNVLNLGWILDRFPNVTFVHVVRDGRAVVNSQRTHPRFRVRRGRLVPTSIVNDLDDCIDLWLREVRAGLRHRSNARVVELRYEDVVADPRGALAPALARIGLTWHEAMESYHRVERDVTRFRQNPEATRPVTSASLDRWRTDLTAEQVGRIEERGGDVLSQLGYL